MAELLSTGGGESVSIVHGTAEYYPYARTGGLAEAGAGLASFQHAAGLAVTAVLPLYLTVLDLPPFGLNLQNTFWAVWLPAGANAFSVLIMVSFFRSLPRELIEAARLDGAGDLRMLWTIVLPLSRPILGVVALLAIIAAWKDFLWPSLVLANSAVQPISVALPIVGKVTDLSVFLAALFLATIVSVLLFLVFQRQILAGVGASAGLKD